MTATAAFAQLEPPVSSLPTVEELRALSEEMESWTARDIIAWAARTYGPERFAATSSFGASSGALLRMLSEVDNRVPVIFLETGYHFEDTIRFRDHIRDLYNLKVEAWGYQGGREAFLAKFPDDLNKRENLDGIDVPQEARRHAHVGTDLCCFLNKVEPLRRALSGRSAYVTSIRRSDHSEIRQRTKILEVSERPGREPLVKINPFANWSKRDLWKYIDEHDVPVHPLFLEGYKSIGCAPCTKPVADGQDERAGRWSGSQKTECGIHTYMSDGI
ncbi:MAG: phosphoadenylyl-sulfate reductase [Sumerlaeia bacterium]